MSGLRGATQEGNTGGVWGWVFTFCNIKTKFMPLYVKTALNVRKVKEQLFKYRQKLLHYSKQPTSTFCGPQQHLRLNAHA